MPAYLARHSAKIRAKIHLRILCSHGRPHTKIRSQQSRAKQLRLQFNHRTTSGRRIPHPFLHSPADETTNRSDMSLLLVLVCCTMMCILAPRSWQGRGVRQKKPKHFSSLQLHKLAQSGSGESCDLWAGSFQLLQDQAGHFVHLEDSDLDPLTARELKPGRTADKFLVLKFR